MTRTSSTSLRSALRPNYSGARRYRYPRLRSGWRALDEAEALALSSGDQTAYHIAWALDPAYVAQGAFDLALSRPVPRDPAKRGHSWGVALLLRSCAGREWRCDARPRVCRASTRDVACNRDRSVRTMCAGDSGDSGRGLHRRASERSSSIQSSDTLGHDRMLCRRVSGIPRTRRMPSSGHELA